MIKPEILLKQAFNALYPISEDEWQSFALHWHPFKAKRKEILTFTGEQEKYLYFILDGVQRIYYYDEQGREATLVFCYQPSFGGVLDSLMLQNPSKYFFETLTASSFLRIKGEELLKMIEEKKELGIAVRNGIMLSFSGILERLVELQCFTSEEKFRKLLERSPHILQIVPHKYLANYLGIDSTNFSKMINKIKI